MPRKAAVITINLEAGTAKLLADMDVAGAKVRQFAAGGSFAGHATRQSMIEASASVRALEGNFDRNIRAVERFLSTTLGLGPVFKVIFPLVGAAATVGILSDISQKVYAFFKNMREAGDKTEAAFRSLNAPVKLANDEMQVANDRLQNEIAKLEGKHENTLRLALDEARVAADRLADSLLKDLETMQKVLAQNNVGIGRRILGEAGTSDLTDMAKKLNINIGILTDQYVAAVDKATTADQKKAAQTEYNTRLTRVYDAAIETLSKKLAKPPEISVGATLIGQLTGAGGPQFADDSNRRKQIEGWIRVLREELGKITLPTTQADLIAKKEGLQAGIANAEMWRPFQDRLKLINAEIVGVQARLAAVGKPEAAQILAKSFAEAEKSITEVNKALERHHTQLNEAQKRQIQTATQTLVTVQAESEWQTKLAAMNVSIREHILSQQLLAAAIGNGYEAMRTANVETRIAQELGSHFGDVAFMEQHRADIIKLRGQLEAEYDAQHGRSIAEAVDKINDQITLERALAAVQREGAEAVREATLAVKVRQLIDQGATVEQIKAEYDLFNAQRENASATDIAKYDERIAAEHRLSAAVLGGAEAERQAALETKYAALAKTPGGTPDVVAKARLADQIDHQNKITQEALKTGIAYQNQLEALNLQITALERIKAVGNDTLALEISLRDLQNQRIKTLAEQSLAGRQAQDGVRAFFIEMQADAKSAAQTVYDALNESLNKVSANLAKLFTGQKTNWAQAFKEIGGQIVESEIKGALQRGLGALGKAFGVEVGKPDGSTANPFSVRIVGGAGALALPGGLSLPGGGGRFGGGAAGGGGLIFSLLGKAFPSFFGAGAAASTAGVDSVMASLFPGFAGLAGGGEVTPGNAYMVGEHGPEPFFPHTAGTVVPNGGFGNNVTYNVDARGADLGAQNRITRGLEATHRAAVANAVAAMHERSRRVPSK